MKGSKLRQRRWHKYKAIPVKHDGIRFDSKREAARYEELKLLKGVGEVVFFLRQTPFHLPGKTTYHADFVVFWKDGSVTVEDVKGIRTEQYKTKKRQVEEIYSPVKIVEL